MNKPVSEDDLAYDGSNNPPKRDLTARERDILCRVISDVLRPASTSNGKPIPVSTWDSIPIRVGEPDFLNVLYEIRGVIDPRKSLKDDGDVYIFTCDKCGYQRSSEEDGKIFHELDSGANLCHDCWEKEGRPE